MRYSRQTQLVEIGEQGQEKLQKARVLVVGAGGLGCQVLPLLVGAGVGYIRIYDADQVDESNLHRQTLYKMTDVGLPKVQAAWQALHALNPSVDIDIYQTRLLPSNVQTALNNIDLVVDAADNFVTTYVLSDACVNADLPLVSASVIERHGYVGAFCKDVPSYRAVFPHTPQQSGNCNTQGVMGSAVAVVGAMQAQIALSLLLDFQPSVLGQLFKFDFVTWQNTKMSFKRAEEPEQIISFIDSTALTPHDFVIELRSNQELLTAPCVDYSIKVSLQDTIDLNLPQKRLVLVCKQGVRALKLASQLQQQGHQNIAVLAMGE
ncbi:HesA/MoeB/ThiF family protein [Acinetobacter sp. HY1485]|uniref:HesA/MoeB/ThiF family protein n=1 Tax=Acinetobacter sp. HY1485 TaxID=2970918 RepID=UPI0022B975B9|nr:HesA/MoeB/ThiF family protein [Acinetobacter sp. HY1485]